LCIRDWFVKMPAIPELWDGLDNMGMKADPAWTDQIFPCLFITIACGAISGFHATQSPLMARCIKSERMGRPIFYGAMITEGAVALIWATVSAYFFYGEPSPGYQLIDAARETGFHTSAPAVVNIICNDWLGVAGGILALLGVVAAPITSGDTAFRSARLIISEFVHIDQKAITRRLLISIPLFVISILMLYWQIENPDGFNIIWQYFGWANQALSVFTLWTITVFLAREHKPYVVTLIPALFMTTVCTTFLLVSRQAFNLPADISYTAGGCACMATAIWFAVWLKKQRSSTLNQNE
ncbi:MAG: carbon starvation protein A, partial [Prevotella sp.]|nr:carbon starvation protein A [Prevotella sp.]